MSNALSKRMDKVEIILAAQLRGQDYYHMLRADDELDLDVVKQRLIREGVVLPRQGRMFVLRARR